MRFDFLLDMKLLLSSLIAAVVSWLIGWIHRDRDFMAIHMVV